METIILGGGLAGVSLAYFLKQKSIILEKEQRLGGLCRSFELNKIFYDIGPHILFSKNEGILNFCASLMGANKIRRSNKIYHNGRLVKYPFENGLSALTAQDRNYCLQTFLSNPHESYEAQNMRQFFLKTFGEGITELYLQPYNKKIWKLDPSFLDIKMVGRVPRPSKEDMLKVARGIETEGYLQQLYFYYPKRGGIQQLVDGFSNLVSDKTLFIKPVKILKISKQRGLWRVQTNRGNFSSKTLVNCMPLPELFHCLEAPSDVLMALGGLRYNSINIVVLQVKGDNLGNNFSLYFADKDIIFHRLSKINFLGEHYAPRNNGSTILAEITYHPNLFCASRQKETRDQVIADLDKLGLVKKQDVTAVEMKNFKYAYVVYDLNHSKNVEYILRYLSGIGITCCGRFAEFEYLNMDAVVEHSQKIAKKLNHRCGRGLI